MLSAKPVFNMNKIEQNVISKQNLEQSVFWNLDLLHFIWGQRTFRDFCFLCFLQDKFLCILLCLILLQCSQTINILYLSKNQISFLINLAGTHTLKSVEFVWWCTVFTLNLFYTVHVFCVCVLYVCVHAWLFQGFCMLNEATSVLVFVLCHDSSKTKLQWHYFMHWEHLH